MINIPSKGRSSRAKRNKINVCIVVQGRKRLALAASSWQKGFNLFAFGCMCDENIIRNRSHETISDQRRLSRHPFIFSGNAERNRRRLSASGVLYSALSRMVSMLLAGQTITGCLPLSKMDRHSCSMGE